MPKIQKLRKYRTAKQASDQVLGATHTLTHSHPDQASGAVATSSSSSSSTPADTTLSLSKGQKKRRQKRASLMVKLGMVEPDLKFSAAKAQAQAQKKSVFNALLSELESSLPAASDVVRPAAAQSVKTNKLKKTLAVRETQRMKLVQQHPAFVENPIDAVKKHIEHMLAMKGSGTVTK
jgi:hypothetical protein